MSTGLMTKPGNDNVAKTPLRPCNKRGCPKFAHGVLTINIPPVGIPRDRGLHIRFIVGFELCEGHASEKAPDDFMTPAWQDAVRAELLKRGAGADPDFDRAWLDLMPLTQREYLDWQREQAGEGAPQVTGTCSECRGHGFKIEMACCGDTLANGECCAKGVERQVPCEACQGTGAEALVLE